MESHIKQLLELAGEILELNDIEQDYIGQLEQEVKRLETVNQTQAIKILELSTNDELESHKQHIDDLKVQIQNLTGDYEKEISDLKLSLLDKAAECDSLNRKVGELEEELNTVQAAKVDTVGKSKLGKLEKQVKTLQQEKNQLEQKLKAFNGVDVKKLKTKLSNLQERNRELLASKEKLIKDVSVARKERDALVVLCEEFETKNVILNEMVDRWRYRNEINYGQAICIRPDAIIALLPQRFRVSVDGVQGVEEQHHLLYSDKRGIWKQVSLDPEGGLSVARPYSHHYAERTQKTIEKVLPQVPDEDRVFMRDWLLRVKENDWNVRDLDVLSLRAGEILEMGEASELADKLKAERMEVEALDGKRH